MIELSNRPMIRRHKYPLNLIFLAAFLFVTLFINYFHTEAVINGFNEEKTIHTHPDRPNNPKNQLLSELR